MVWTRTATYRLGIAVLFLFVMVAVAITASRADAAVNMDKFSTQLTNPSDVSAGGTPGAVDLHLKNVTNIAQVKRNVLAAYFPKSVTKANGMELKVSDGRKGRVCNINAGKVPAGTIRITIAIAGGETSVREVDIKNVCSTNGNTPNHKKFFGTTLKFPNGKLKSDSDVGLNRADITVALTGPGANSGTLGGSDEYSLNYNLRLAGTNSGKGRLALKGEELLGFRSSYQDRLSSASNRQVRAGVVFGFPCDVNPSSLTNTQRSVQLYDADAGFGDTYMWVEKNGTPLAKVDYNQTASQRIGTWQGDRWKLQDSNQDWNILVMKSDAINVNATYRVFVLNTGKNGNSNSNLNPHGNTLSLKIPYDSIYGAGKCSYTLAPDVYPPNNSNSSVTENSVISATGHVVPDGFDTDNHNWTLTARVYAKKPGNRSKKTNGQDACTWRAGRSGTCETLDDGNRKFRDTFDKSVNYNTATRSFVKAGDWVCFMMSVQKPTYNSAGTRWAHSAMKCVGVQGDDSGTVVTPPTYSYYPTLTATSTIENLGGYPKIDTFGGTEYPRNEYGWQIYEAKFRNLPSGGIGASVEGGACENIRNKYDGNFIMGSCENVANGNNLFPDSASPKKKSATASKDTPDPIGTWTCYTLRYRTNPGPSAQLEAAIDNYVTEQNNPPYRYWIPDEKDEDGNITVPGHYNRDAILKSDIFNPYKNAEPTPSPAKFTYTDFEDTSCSVSGIDPKVQVQGHDARVSGSIQTSLRTITAGPYAASYGSWGEYGVLSSGVNMNMASGVGLNGGGSANQADWSKLTFANNSSIFGNFNGGSMWRDFNPNQVTEINNDLSVNSASGYTSGKRVYVVNGTLTINTNLEYGNAYSAVGQIPRVILVAENIVVGPNVTRIDPWLITTGALNTCGAVPTDSGFAEANLTTDGACRHKLTFNGPVTAGHLYLFRTAGSRDSYNSPDGKKTLSEPAEVFNLRADAFLSSFSNETTPHPVAITDRITELPPRF